MKLRGLLLILSTLNLIKPTINQQPANVFFIKTNDDPNRSTNHHHHPEATSTTTSQAEQQDGSKPRSGPISSLTNAELNAILSYKLNISQFERLPDSLHPTTYKSQLILNDPHTQLPLQTTPTTITTHHPHNQDRNLDKLIILIHGTDGQDVLPLEIIKRSQWFKIPNPPDGLSFEGLMITYMGRMIDSLKLRVESIYGLKDFLVAYHDRLGLDILSNSKDFWSQDWSSDTSNQWFDFIENSILSPPSSSQNSDQDRSHQKKKIIPIELKYQDQLKDYGALDLLGYQLIEDLRILDEFIEERLTNQNTKMNGGTSFLRLNSLQVIKNRYGEGSPQFRTALRIIKTLITNILNEFSKDSRIEETIVIGLPNSVDHSSSRLVKRTNLSILSPFKTFDQSFIRRDLINKRREIFVDRKINPSSDSSSSSSKQSSLPIVSNSQTCFRSKSECQQSTKSCHDHGDCVQALKPSSTSSQQECFICSCSTTKDPNNPNQVIHWSGEFCQKRDISSGFILLLITSLSFLTLVLISIYFLNSIGTQHLPQQLTGLSNHSSKKND